MHLDWASLAARLPCGRDPASVTYREWLWQQVDLYDAGTADVYQVADGLAAAQQQAKKSGTAHAEADLDPNDPRAIASFYAERFLEDARALGLKVAIEADASEAKRKELMPKATESIDGMIAMIEDLASKGFAYRAGDAVYFDVQKYDRYGELSGNTLDKLRGGAGSVGDPCPGLRFPI